MPTVPEATSRPPPQFPGGSSALAPVLVWSPLEGGSRDSLIGKDPQTGIFATISPREEYVEKNLLRFTVEVFDRWGRFLSRDPGLPRPKLPHFSGERAKEWAEKEILHLRKNLETDPEKNPEKNPEKKEEKNWAA